MSDSDSLDYLKTGFDPASLTVPRLRSILVSHDVEYPSGAKKPQLIQIFVDKVVPQSRKILAARARARRTSKGITDADSQESTTSTTETTDITGGDEDVMPPPPTPRTRTRKPSAKIRADESESDLPVSRSPTKRASRASSKRPRASDTETDHYPDSVQRSVRKTRRSEDPTPVPVSAVREPRIKLEDVDNTEDSSRRESAFTYDNPFQSGSSPLSSSRSPSGERRRKSHGVTASTRKSTSTTRRRTDVPKVDDGFHPPTSATFEIPVSDLADLKDYDENGVEAFEEFTPEEQLELVRERSAKGLDALGPRRPKKQSPGFNKSKPIWLAFLTLLGGYAMWYRQEKIAVGYCGVGREAHEIFPTEVEVPDWIRILVEPECEPCPPHAYCYQKLQTECEADFVLRPHPLSLGSLVPLPPTCEPDGEKIGRIMKVADRAVKVLRARKADWECGGLTDETGAPDTTLEIDEEALKKQVIHNKGKKIGISASEFEELWAGAIGEVQGREEVISIEDGNRILLASTSTVEFPYLCQLRRSVRGTMARYRLQIASVILLLSFLMWLRYYLISRAAQNAAIPHLVSLTLDRLANQASLHAMDAETYPESWISIGQLRDDVLRDQHSVSKRTALWDKVKDVVEMNANVRASQRESRNGEISRVWEWIGAISGLESGEKRRKSGRVSWGAYDQHSSPVSGNDGGPEIVQQRWQEGRPIY